MKGVSVLITVLLVALAQQLAQGLKRTGALPLEHQVRNDHSSKGTTRSVLQFAQTSAEFDEERTRLEEDNSSSGALQKRLWTGRTPRPLARFACTDLGTGSPSLLRF